MPHPDWPQRWDPFHALEREVGRFLESLSPRASSRSFRPFPLVNLYEAADRFILTTELPGLVAEDLDLSISGETLTLRGQRARSEAVPDEAYRRQEREFGAWSRVLTFPSRIDGERITANFQNGILTVVLPKADIAIARQIRVNNGEG